jgi:hypothetical protein
MAFSPSSRVYLLDTPLDNTYKNQLYFEAANDQYAYFMSCKTHVFENITYVRKDNIISVPAYIDTLYDCNYVMYQNTNFGSKWFYAFITKMEYKNPNCTDIYIETDVYQTWISNINLKKSFVIREHVTDDTIGKHTVNEGLDLGEYIMNDYVKTNAVDDLWFILAVSDTISNTDTVIRGIYGNVYSGLAYFAYAQDDIAALSTHINNYVAAQKSDAIQFIYTIPRKYLPANLETGHVIPNFSDINTSIFNYKTFDHNDPDQYAKFQQLDTYIPVNKKLYCYPYNFLYVTNNTGGSCEYRFEDFEDFETLDYITFYIDGNMSPNPTLLFYPYDNYRYSKSGQANDCFEYGISLTGFPFCSWANDTFVAWLSQNAVQSALSFGGSGLALIGGIVTGNPIAIGGGAIGIGSQIAEYYRESSQPNQAKGNVNGATLNVAAGRLDFYVSRMSIKKEYAERIDNYFSMFGYKVNAFKVPQLHTRKYWNYIQTMDVNIEGAIPDNDMIRLKQMFNDGVTFWHDPKFFCHYEAGNTIL